MLLFVPLKNFTTSCSFQIVGSPSLLIRFDRGLEPIHSIHVPEQSIEPIFIDMASLISLAVWPRRLFCSNSVSLKVLRTAKAGVTSLWSANRWIVLRNSSGRSRWAHNSLITVAGGLCEWGEQDSAACAQGEGRICGRRICTVFKRILHIPFRNVPKRVVHFLL